MRKNGFTLIELMIVLAFIGILASLFVGAKHGTNRNDNHQYMQEETSITECIDGYKFHNGVQILDANRGGVPCS